MGIRSFLLRLTGRYDLGEKGPKGRGIFGRANGSGLQSFGYSYDGTIGADSYSYKIQKEKDENTGEEKTFFIYSDMTRRDYGDMKKEISPDVLAQLYEIYLKHKICRWDGFSRYNPNVCDGDGFSLWMRFGDGASLSAHGSNACPEGYGAFMSDMNKILLPLANETFEQARERRIANGTDGDLYEVIARFANAGDGGKDSYDISVSLFDPGVEEIYLDLKSGGEYFPEGKINGTARISGEDVILGEIQGIIDRYGLIRWLDYEGRSDREGIREYFSVSFRYDGGLQIDARGTEHPENYDVFKKEFLTLVSRVYAEHAGDFR